MPLNYTIKLVLLLCPFALATGLSSFIFEDNPQADLFVMMLIWVFSLYVIFWWYVKDSEKHNYQRSKMLNAMVIAIGFISLPYYFFRSRGANGGLKATVVFIFLFVGWYILLFAGYFSAMAIYALLE